MEQQKEKDKIKRKPSGSGDPIEDAAPPQGGEQAAQEAEDLAKEAEDLDKDLQKRREHAREKAARIESEDEQTQQNYRQRGGQ